MNYEDDLSAPVWDDLAPKPENDPTVDQLAQNLGDLSSTEHAVSLEHSAWSEDGGEKEDKHKEAADEEGPESSKTLLSSLAPEEDPLSDLSASNVITSPTKDDPLFSGSTKSPLKVSDSDFTARISETSLSSRKYGKPQRLFSSTRLRRHPLTDEQKKDLFVDPLAIKGTTQDDDFVDESLEYDTEQASSKQDIMQQVDAPLFKLSPRKSPNTTPHVKHIAQPDNDEELSNSSKQVEESSNEFVIEVVDPVKVGDLTSAHMEYTVWTRYQNTDNPETRVQRRYRDFRWLYRQLQSNNWGKIIPPPPEKQAVGRFKDDFIENRRFQMERMLKKIAQDAELQRDIDFVMFLTSNNFSQDSKVRENLTGSNASSDSNDISEIHISEIELLGEEDAVNVMRNGGIDESHKGFMSISFSSLPRYNEPDQFFVDQRQSTDILEEQLRQLYKSLELVDTQRNELASVTEEFAQSVKPLEELEVTKEGSTLLSNFAEVHLRLKESLQRSSMQEALTLGVTIDEYLRSLGSIKATLNQRAKLGYFLMIVENDLNKKQSQLEKLNRNMKSHTDKINATTKEAQILQKRFSKIKQKWQDIGETIRQELSKHDQEKVKDFRNNMEIFLESAIESQKECIELWETFYQNNL